MYLKTPRCLKCFVFILQDLSACVRGWFTSTGAKSVLTLRNSGLNILLQLKHVSRRAFKKQCLGEFEKIEERFSTAWILMKGINRQPNLRTLGPWQGKYNLKWKHRSQTTWCWLGRGSEKDSSRECHWDTCMWRITSRPTMSQLVVEGKKNLHPAIHLKMA